MTSTSISAAAAVAAPLCVASDSTTRGGTIAKAAQNLLLKLERGQRVYPPPLRAAMESAFGVSDAEGGWNWKTAYDACEAATGLFIRKVGPAMRARAASPASMLPMLAKIARLLPTHARRSEESEALQQFSTPIMLGLAASIAAAITPADVVLEPSAGTGLLAILAKFSGASLVLNALAETRAELLSQTETGERVIGRKVSAAWVANALESGEPSLSPDDAYTPLIDGKTILDLAEGLQLRRVRVMGVNRIEWTGFYDTMRDRLRTYGLFSEIISWKLRFLVPIDTTGPTILARVLERYPIERIADRAAT